MQPDNNPVSTPEPVVTPQPAPAPVQQPVAAPQPVVNNNVGSESFIKTYINTLKTLFTNPKAFFDNPPATLAKSLIFPGINLAIMAIISIITQIISALTIKTVLVSVTVDADFFGTLFKNLGLSALYIAIFLAAIAGIIMVFALISKKTVTFKDIFSMSSIFSLNFLALAVSLIIGLFAGWVGNIDFYSITGLISNIVVSLVFVYAGILIIQGINEVSGFNIFKSTAIYVVSIIMMAFIFGKMITTFYADFSISFGQYSNSSFISSKAIQVEQQIDNIYKKVFNY